MSARIDESGISVGGPSQRGRRSVALKVLTERRSALIGAITVVLIILIALFAGVLAPHSTLKSGPSFCRPSIHHWLGCDDGGVDILTLLMYGARVSLIVGLAATAVSSIIGGGVGLIAGYYGGATDIALMRITDYFLILPEVPLMIVAAALYGGGLINIIIIIGIVLWAWTARVIRSQVKSVKERVYVRRAESLGASNFRIMFGHVLPQIMPLLVANTVLTVSVAVFDETVLAFLGLSDPTKISWGNMIEAAFNRSAMSNGAWWAIVPPGLAVGILCLAFSLWGQAIEDALNPRLKVSHLSSRHFRLRPLPVSVAE